MEETFKSNGFKIFYPEKLSIQKQIALMKNCRALAGIQGTALNLSLFAQDNIELTIIHKLAGNIFTEQLKINAAKNINSSSIEACLDFLRPFPNNDVQYAVSIKNKYMSQYMKDSGYKFSGTVEKPKTLEDYLGKKEYKKMLCDIRLKQKIKEMLGMAVTNLIPVKKLR
ncbi:MAG: glycosyltransferase family 61 protein, partial [Endomicrobium sp.]|nr:glycosyltransferase family 61 protein [Endomicrobium sp.]